MYESEGSQVEVDDRRGWPRLCQRIVGVRPRFTINTRGVIT